MKKIFILLLISLLSLSARPVDLSPPTTEIGFSTKDGLLSLHRELGEIDFGAEVVLPLRLYFTSYPQSSSSCFGFTGWSIPVMDSKITFLDQSRIEAYLLCGKTIYFIKSPSTGKWKSLDSEWEGDYEASREKFVIKRDDGWEVEWLKNKIKRLKTDEGRELTWDYESGIPLVIKEGDRKVFQLTQVNKRVEMLQVRDKTYRLKYDRSGRLEQVTWPSGRQESYRWSVCKQGNPQLRMIDKQGREEFFAWDKTTGYLTEDRVWDYKVEIVEPAKDGKQALVRIARENEFKQKESYFNQRDIGEVVTERADGLKQILTRFVTPGKLYHKTRKIEQIQEGTSKVVYQASYDEGGRVIREIDARGNETKFRYVLQGEGEKAKIKVMTKTDALGGEWITEMNSDEFPTSVTNPLGQKTSYEWDTKRHLISMTNGLNIKVMSLVYDDQGLITEFKDALGHLTSFEYNQDKKMIQITDPSGQIWKTDRNEEGEITAIVNPLNERLDFNRNKFGLVRQIKDAMGFVTRYQYDERSRLSQLSDANGNQTQWKWDALDRVTLKVNANQEAIQIGYDLMNRQNKIQDPLNRSYEMAYQKFGDRTEFKFTDGKSQKYQYDDNGNLTRFTNRAGSVFTYQYDALDRLTQTQWADGIQIRYGYDSANRLTRVQKTGSASSVLTFRYDAAGQLIAESQGDKVISYQYDFNGRVTKITYPTERVVNYVYDSRGMMTSLASTEGTIQYQRDALGRVTSKQNPNGTLLKQKYDKNSRITEMTLQGADQKTLWKNGYEFDKVGNRTATSYMNGTQDLYQYDNVYQVTGVRYGIDPRQKQKSEPENESVEKMMKADPKRARYQYDAVGNRLFSLERGKVTAYTTNNLNQYLSVGKGFYQYNQRGDLTSDGTWSYSYDMIGNLIGATNGTSTLKFEFDALNRRMTKTVNGTKEEYIYSGLDRIMDITAGQADAEYLFEPGIDRPVQITRHGKTYFVQQDILGNVVALTNQEGKIQESISYEVFGLTTVLDDEGKMKSKSISPFLFTGREYDSEIGIYHYRARAYSPIVGRFMQLDPIDLKAGDISLVRYVGNNAVNFYDPLGKVVEDPKKECESTAGGILQKLIDFLKDLFDLHKEGEKFKEKDKNLFDKIDNINNPENPTPTEDVQDALDSRQEQLQDTLNQASETAASGAALSAGAAAGGVR